MAKKRGPDTFISRLFTRHEGLRKIEGRRAREMARVMKDVKKQALSLIDRNMTTFREAGEYINSAAAVSRAEQTVVGIDALMAQRSDWATSEVLSMRKEAWTQGVADIEFAAGRLPGDVRASMQGSFGQAFPEAAFSAVENPVLGVSPDAMFNGVRAGTTQNMRNVLVNAVISGESVQETGRRLSDAMDISVAAGERIARTNVNAMYNEAQRSVYDANSDIIAGYAWEATLDDRTSRVCFMLHGEFWPVGSKTPGPPAHWNCRSILVPVFKDPAVQSILDETPRRARQYTKTGKFRSTLVKGSTTPEQWARRQPTEVTLRITGSKLKNSLFRRKLIGFDDLVDPSLRVRTDEEIIRRVAALHPGNKALAKQARALGIKTVPSPASVRKTDAALAKKQPWDKPEPSPDAVDAAVPSSVYKRAETFEDAIQQMETLLPRTDVRVEGAQDSAMLERLNVIASDTAEMRNKLPGFDAWVRHQDRLLSIDVVSSALVELKGHPVGGYYSSLSKSIWLGRGKDARIFSPRIGRWNISNGGFDGYYRHEIGHAIHRSMRGSSLEGRWANMYWDQPSNWWETKVSSYASTGHKEGFAECFSLYTDPLYGTRESWRLPKIIEEFFDDVFKKEGVL